MAESAGVEYDWLVNVTYRSGLHREYRRAEFDEAQRIFEGIVDGDRYDEVMMGPVLVRVLDG